MKSPFPVIKPILLACSFALSACGGSDGDGGTPTSLTGTAAAGAAIVGQVTVKGSLGNTKSALIEADGSYTVDVTGLTAPYRLRAEGSVGGKTYRLHSYAEAADVGGTVNITPFTDLIISNAAGQIAEAYFDSNTPANLDPAEVDAQEDALQAKLKDVFDALGVDATIDLLNSSFRADHSGLDAALDVVSVEVDASTNVATITNLIENTKLSDSIVDDSLDDVGALVVTDANGLTTTVNDIQAISGIFTALTDAFSAGLPSKQSIESFFTTDFLEIDQNLDQFLTEITTDPSLVGLAFSNAAITIESPTTATTIFQVAINGYIEDQDEPIIWQAVKDGNNWKLHGDQVIVDYWFNYHCNDYDGNDNLTGACGVNTMIEDNDFSNNGTGGSPIASATASIIDGTDGVTVKAVIYMGTPSIQNGGSAGRVEVYNAGNGYQGDWKPFGTGAGEIDPSILVSGDTVRFDLYTQDLDISNPSNPMIASGATPVFTFERPVVFAPATIGNYPTMTSVSQSALSAFTLGSDLTISWTSAAGMLNEEVLVIINDGMGNRFEIENELLGTSANSVTVSSSELSATAATSAGLDANAVEYYVTVRIYTQDPVTGQSHSTDYHATIPGPAAGGGSGGAGSGLACSYESPWDNQLGQPSTFNSFTDFEAVIADCGGKNTISAATFNNTTWVDTWMEGQDTIEEVVTFNSNGTLSFTEKTNGLVTDGPINANWSVSNDYLILTIGGVFQDIWAFTSSGQKVYTEEAGWGSDLTADGTADGEIWTANYVMQ